MKVLHVITGISRKAGGPSRSSQGLVAALCKAGADAWIYSFDNADPWILGVRKFTQTLSTQTLKHFDLVHIHGIWDLRLHKVAMMCRKTGVPYVISPRGMLDPWALSVKKWKKRLGMLLYQRGDLKHAVAFHATAELEAKNIRAQGLKQPIIVAPNGVDVPQELPEVKGEGERRTAIFLSRLHPGKGLLTLAEAWARVKPQGWLMRVVGPDSYGHKAEVLEKLDALGITHADAPACTQSNNRTFEHSNNSSWQFVDMVDDKAKWQEYAAAEILIHPSVSENFGITIAEGLYAGLPVICTKGTPWKDVEDFDCGKWIDVGLEPLVEALAQLLTLPLDRLRALGANGRALVERKYLWPAIAKTMILGYEQILAAFARL